MLPNTQHTIHALLFTLNKLFFTILSIIINIIIIIRPLVFRLFGVRSPRPGDTPVLSTKWLTETLKHYSFIQDKGDEVLGIEVNDLNGNKGLVGCVKGVNIVYRKDNKNNNNNDRRPTSLILKMNHPTGVGRESTRRGGGYREALFYGCPLASSLSDTTPHVIYSYGSKFFGEYLILMEDLLADREKKASPASILFGNQCWGLPPTPPSVSLGPLKLLEAVYLKCADMHAAYWKDEGIINDYEWLKGAGWYRGRDRDLWERGIRLGNNMWIAAKKKYITEKGNVNLSPKLIKIIENSFKHATWELLQTHLHDKSVPWTLCHGDLHAGNIMATKCGADTDVVFFDWSEVGPWEPTTDLAQTIISDVNASLFVHTNSLVRKYWQRLIDLRCTNEDEYPFDSCWEAFCRGGGERWVWIFSLIAGMPSTPDAFVQYLHDQLLAFVDSHGDYEYYVLKPIVIT